MERVEFIASELSNHSEDSGSDGEDNEENVIEGNSESFSHIDSAKGIELGKE